MGLFGTSFRDIVRRLDFVRKEHGHPDGFMWLEVNMDDRGFVLMDGMDFERFIEMIKKKGVPMTLRRGL